MVQIRRMNRIGAVRGALRSLNMLEQELERNRRIQEDVANGGDPAALD